MCRNQNCAYSNTLTHTLTLDTRMNMLYNNHSYALYMYNHVLVCINTYTYICMCIWTCFWLVVIGRLKIYFNGNRCSKCNNTRQGYAKNMNVNVHAPNHPSIHTSVHFQKPFWLIVIMRERVVALEKLFYKHLQKSLIPIVFPMS